MVKVAVVTGSRSEYGLLQPLINLIHNDQSTELLLFVTGSHLSHYHGLTVNEIAYPIAERIEIVPASDTPVAISKAMGLALVSFGEAYERHRPDLVLVLGDRYESFCASVAAHMASVPIGHIHGGELTEGSLDDALRHSITKLACLHFPAAGPYAKRIQQLGEDKKTIHCVGALGCQGLKKRTPIRNDKPLFLVMHYTEEGFGEILNALDDKGWEYDIILPSSDVGVSEVRRIASECGCNVLTGLPRETFIRRLIETYDAMIGNSSAGIIEAPCIGIPSINVGNRQKGRLMADSVIQAEPTVDGINRALDWLNAKEFRWRMKGDYLVHYKGGDVAESIFAVVKQAVKDGFRPKRFYDIVR